MGKLISIKCPNDGAVVEYDPMSLTAKCPYCGSWLENSEPSPTTKSLLRKYEGFRVIGDIEGQRASARELQVSEPGDFRGWWGEYALDVKHDGESFTYLNRFPDHKKHLRNMARTAKYAPSEWKASILEEELEALSRDAIKLSQIRARAERELLPLEEEIGNLKDMVTSTRRQVVDAEATEGDLKNWVSTGALVCGLVLSIIVFINTCTSSGGTSTLYGSGSFMDKAVSVIFLCPFSFVLGALPGVLIGPLFGQIAHSIKNKKAKKAQKLLIELESKIGSLSEVLSTGMLQSRQILPDKAISVRDLVRALTEKERQLNDAIKETREEM